MIDIQKNKDQFLEIVKENIHRAGIDKLLAFLERSDFYTAPASTKYHLAEEAVCASTPSTCIGSYTVCAWRISPTPV